MKTPASSDDRTQSLAVDGETIAHYLIELSNKIDAFSHSTNEVKADVGAIKARLFNGLTDTMRETYAKVIILENKQEETSRRMYDAHKCVLETLTYNDNKHKVFYVSISVVMALIIVIFSVNSVYKLQYKDKFDTISAEKREVFNGLPEKDHGWSLVGP
jgi:hypothetical protein